MPVNVVEKKSSWRKIKNKKSQVKKNKEKSWEHKSLCAIYFLCLDVLESKLWKKENLKLKIKNNEENFIPSVTSERKFIVS